MSSHYWCNKCGEYEPCACDRQTAINQHNRMLRRKAKKKLKLEAQRKVRTTLTPTTQHPESWNPWLLLLLAALLFKLSWVP